MLTKQLKVALTALAALSVGCGDSQTASPASIGAAGYDGSAPPSDQDDGGAIDVTAADQAGDALVSDDSFDDTGDGSAPSDMVDDGNVLSVPCAGAGCPTEVAPGHLQLWLRGDQGVECVPQVTSSRVTMWRDLSGHDRHAVPPGAKVGPICGKDTMNGHSTITFPRTDGLEDEEYLEVDLASLVGTGFTIAIVEKRDGSVHNSYMLGSRLQFPNAISCVANVNANRGLLLGYPAAEYLNASTWGSECDVIAEVDGPPVSPSLIVMTYEPAVGLKAFLGGNNVGESTSEGLKAIVKGLVGRGYELADQKKDTRYRGQIAEIVVFDAALTDDARNALELHLKTTWSTGP